MKTQLTILSTVAAVLGMMNSAQAQLLSGPVNNTEVSPQIVIQGAVSNSIINVQPVATSALHRGVVNEQAFDDVYAWCLDMVRELRQARNNANRMAYYGNFEHANNILFNALEKAGNRSRDGLVRPTPHTAEAIFYGLDWARAVIATSNQNLDCKLGAQVKFNFLFGLVGVILYAHDDIDSNNYKNLVQKCKPWQSPCWTNENFESNLPDHYFDGLKKLAAKFLTLQANQADAMASNKLEMVSSRVVTSATIHILRQSMYRRSFCNMISSLENTLATIDSYVGPTPGFPPYAIADGVMLIRAELQSIARDLNGLRPNNYQNPYCN